jgi:hypothetical protein
MARYYRNGGRRRRSKRRRIMPRYARLRIPEMAGYCLKTAESRAVDPITHFIGGSSSPTTHIQDHCNYYLMRYRLNDLYDLRLQYHDQTYNEGDPVARGLQDLAAHYTAVRTTTTDYKIVVDMNRLLDSPTGHWRNQSMHVFSWAGPSAFTWKTVLGDSVGLGEYANKSGLLSADYTTGAGDVVNIGQCPKSEVCAHPVEFLRWLHFWVKKLPQGQHQVVKLGSSDVRTRHTCTVSGSLNHKLAFKAFEPDTERDDDKFEQKLKIRAAGVTDDVQSPTQPTNNTVLNILVFPEETLFDSTLAAAISEGTSNHLLRTYEYFRHKGIAYNRYHNDRPLDHMHGGNTVEQSGIDTTDNIDDNTGGTAV